MVSSSLPETTRGGMEMEEGGHAETEWNQRAAVGNRRDAFFHASSPDQIVDEIANLRDDLPVIRASYCTCSSFAAIEILNPKPISSIYPGRQEHALSPHHAARPQPRQRAEILPGCAGIEGSPPRRQRQGEIHPGVPVRPRRRRPAESRQGARCAAGRTHLQLG